MHYFQWIAGTILAITWLSRIIDAAIGMPKVADISTPEWNRNPVSASGNPRVSIVVPARNEEENIERCLTSLLNLDYENYEVIAVDDRSTDRTGEIMEGISQSVRAGDTAGCPSIVALSATGRGSVPRLRVIHHRELPSGWLGKTHAMWTAGNQATGDWLLFTDADVLFKPDSLRRALAYAEAEKADHLVLFPQMIMKTPGEFMMIAFFQSLFVWGHRPWKVADPHSRDHIGVGAFNLIRRRVYDSIGTYAVLRMEVVDDMKLGKLVKNAGFAQRNVFGADLISIRWARGAMGVVENLTKNFFAVLSFQWWRTLISAFGLAFLNLMPFLGIAFARGWQRLPYAVALASMFLIYVGLSRRSSLPAYYFVLHPIGATLFVYTLLRSMFHTLWNQGIVWRGTKYPLEELRKGMV
jgi:glycosyltransferase involved in cell wall biosynthesis